MSDHVLDAMLDYLAGNLSASRRQEIEEHVARCEECAQQFDWARKLRDEALAQDLAHLTATRILDLATGSGAEQSDSEREHFDRCPDCRAEVDWARSLPSEADALVEERSAPHRRTPIAWWWPALGLATAAVALALLFFLPRPAKDLGRLARIEPLPVEVTRDAGDGGALARQRRRGLELYAAGDYSAARDSLLEALQHGTDDAVSLYLASSELLLGMREAALDRLRPLSQRASDGALREEALWQLANAALVAGSIAESERTLRELVAMGDYHATDAAALLDRIEAARR